MNEEKYAPPKRLLEPSGKVGGMATCPYGYSTSCGARSVLTAATCWPVS